MEQVEQTKEIDLVALSKAVWARRKKIALWAVVGLAAGIVVAYSIPRQYTSEVKTAPETQSKKDAMGQLGGLAAMVGVSAGGSVDGGLDKSLYPEIIRSAPFLDEFTSIQIPYKGQTISLKQYLLEEQRQPWWNYLLNAPSALVDWVFSLSSDRPNSSESESFDPANPSAEIRNFEALLAERLSVETDKKTGLITMQAKMQSPEAALVVADSLFAKLSRYMTEYYTSKARKDLVLSQELLIRAKKDYYQKDSLYAAAVDRNQNLVSKLSQIKIERYQNERNIAFSVYQQLASQVEANKITLQQDTPIATVIEPSRLPNNPSAPNKKIIILGLALVGIFVGTSREVIRFLTARTSAQ